MSETRRFRPFLLISPIFSMMSPEPNASSSGSCHFFRRHQRFLSFRPSITIVAISRPGISWAIERRARLQFITTRAYLSPALPSRRMRALPREDGRNTLSRRRARRSQRHYQAVIGLRVHCQQHRCARRCFYNAHTPSGQVTIITRAHATAATVEPSLRQSRQV